MTAVKLYVHKQVLIKLCKQLQNGYIESTNFMTTIDYYNSLQI